MMAGLYLVSESGKDEARIEEEQRDGEIQKDPACAVNELVGVLQATGLSGTSLAAIRDQVTKNPLVIRKFENAVACEEAPSPVRSCRLCMPAGWALRILPPG
jgi:hypothetical protein